MELAVVDCTSDRLGELFEFRARVWIDEGADPSAFDDGSWPDGPGAHRTHWMVLDDDRIVAAASISLHATLADVEEPEAYAAVPAPPPGTVAAPARVVVDAAYRGHGLATLLLDHQDDAARHAGAVLAVRQASPAMKRLLERRGWRDHGPGPADPRFPGVRFTVMSLVLQGESL